jgi:hypothetical protein
MKKRIAALIALLFLTFAPAGLANAQFFEDICSKTPDAAVCKDSKIKQDAADNSITGPNGIIAKATNVLTFVIGIAAFIVIIIAGFQFVLGVGDPARISNARNTLVYALAGILVAVMAQVIVKFVVNKV